MKARVTEGEEDFQLPEHPSAGDKEEFIPGAGREYFMSGDLMLSPGEHLLNDDADVKLTDCVGIKLPALRKKRVYVTCEPGIHNMRSDFFDELLQHTLHVLRVPNKYRVDVELVSKATIRQYNREKRGVDKVTDVLSFPSIDYIRPLKPRDPQAGKFLLDEFSGLYQLGEILICRSVCAAQSQEYGHSMEREMGYLFVHGVLHILGFDHVTEDGYRMMRDIEEKVLAMVGLKR